MPYVSGSLSRGWAVLDVLVGVSVARRGLLVRHNFSVPQPVAVRALIDSDAPVSGFAPRVFRELDLTPVAKLGIITSSTSAFTPYDCDLFDVSLALVAGGAAHVLPDLQVMSADCWHPDEGFEALLGMDVLTRGFFQLMGPERQFVFAF